MTHPAGGSDVAGQMPSERRLWTRDVEGQWLVDAFLVSAACGLFAIRLYLYLAGYPRLGGGTIHVAHMLWGGLLLVIALLLMLVLVTPRVRRVAAICGGLGFGLFIDELGKFVTSDNNYFFRPTALLVYAIFVALYLVGRLVVARGNYTSTEYLVSAIDELKRVPLGELRPTQRARALAWLRRAEGLPSAGEVRDLFERAQVDWELDPWSRIERWSEERYQDIRDHPWFTTVLSVLIMIDALAVGALVAGILVTAQHPWAVEAHRAGGALPFVGWLAVGASCLAGALAVVATLVGSRHWAMSLRLFEAALYVTIFVTLPIAFYEAQFFASAAAALSVLMLGAVQYAIARHRATSAR